MSLILFAASITLPTLIRVDIPEYPDAVSYSETGSVLLEPPPEGTPWRYESIAELDVWEVGEEAREAVGTPFWHEKGALGQGVKIAVFDLGWFEPVPMASSLNIAGSQDCFAHRSCEEPIAFSRPRFSFEQGSHGFACAEVIRSIAPEAMLYLVRVNGFTSLENAVNWAIREEIDVVSMSMSFFNDSFYDGTGPFRKIMEQLEANDVLMVSSAGNYAQQHWTGTYRDGDGDGRMDGDGGNGLWVYIHEGVSQSLYINWNQHRLCGRTDLNAYLFDPDRNIVGKSERVQKEDGDWCQPVERLRGYIEEAGWYRLEIHHAFGSVMDLQVDIHTRSGEFEHPVSRQSMVEPSVQPTVFSVGAVDVRGYFGNNVESFSSWGPTHSGESKPDIVGPDGLTTHTYGPRGFFGTSASTPVVAALIGILLSDAPDLTPRMAADQLKSWALADGFVFAQHNPRMGSGKARLPVTPSEEGGCQGQGGWVGLWCFPVWLGWRRRSKF